MSEMLKVGDRVWEFDINKRVYAPGAQRGPIFAEHFRERWIVGEEGRSWLVSTDRRGTWGKEKIGKHHLAKRHHYTDAEREAMIWANDHRYKLVRRLERCTDLATLKAIAEILGYNPDSQEAP